MNLLEYFKQYPILAQKAEKVVESDASIYALSQMKDLLENYVPDGIDRRTEYRLSDEKEFIRLHCIEGISVEQAAERMCISRDTAYRIRRRLCAKEVTAVPCVS
ncbi:MAG: helix-turn-helix domain-containing protein [Ruminococcaceae bacterium]|nr:helix-turn-helix domain-containing protein [Oscillospiraceae bacterium]